MIIMENDEFKIPERYQKMSVTQLDEEARKVMEQIKSMPRDIRSKKKAAKGRKEIKFYV